MRGQEVGRKKNPPPSTADDGGGSNSGEAVEYSRSFASTSTNSQDPFRARTRTNSTVDDSVVDERCIGGTSWEGLSFDSEEYQRQAKKLERRKFDTSTPTLIDEEEDEAEMLQLNMGDASSLMEKSGETMRRTPGASMYKSNFSNEEDASNMRRTPGASGAQQSGDTASNAGSDKPAMGHGFGFSLSVTGAATKPTPASTKTRKQKNESPGPFSYSPWSRQPSADVRAGSGSVSPNILRLTEDIGNLLQDEDDDYATDIPSVFGSDEGFDWTGAYTYDGNRRTRPAVPRTAPTLEKSRRRPAAEITNPKPRRNEVFGGFVNQDANQPPLVLGGAFAPAADFYQNRPRVFSLPGQPDLMEANSHEHARSFEWPFPGQQAFSPASNMQATAQVFVPRSTTPQFNPPLMQPQVVHSHWNSPYGYYGASQDPRSSPSHLVHQGLPQQEHIMDFPDLALAPMSTSPHTLDSSSHQRGRRDQAKKKHRGKRKGKAEGVRKQGKYKGKGDASSTFSHDGADDHQASTSEAEVKKGELVESPQTRAIFKEFYRAFRAAERESFQAAEDLAMNSLADGSLPEKIHWRVFLELADLAKRSNRFVKARCLYQKVCDLQPYASQGWLEYSKLEEECGNMNRVMNILHKGLSYCEFNENLLTRAVKHQEKHGNLSSARGLLARLKHASIDKVWRTVLEGALLEARSGNVAVSRRVLKYLMNHVPWYGPLYLEAYKVEKDQGHPLDALQIVERGLETIPRYGPLWFAAFRLTEEIDMGRLLYTLPMSTSLVERAAFSISKELVWKVYLEASQMQERAAIEQSLADGTPLDSLLFPSRHRLAATVVTCPNNLRWKVWLSSARMELGAGNSSLARDLFLRAHSVVPAKGRSSTLIECARLEEFVGETDLARAVLCKARHCYGHDWRVWLESLLLEIRCCDYGAAIRICDRALEIHQGTGRLWATLVQLRQHESLSIASQQITLQRALNAVPKSGEVWCEGGRLHLNPFSATFNLNRARRHLFFATRFTPQYGDGFVETVRLEILQQWLDPIAEHIWTETRGEFGSELQSSGDSSEALTKYILNVALAISFATNSSGENTVAVKPRAAHRKLIKSVQARLTEKEQLSSSDLNGVRLTCVNADPNYGSLWFHCRQKATDTPRRIIEDAAGIIASELRKYSHVYLAALIRQKAIMSTLVGNAPDNAGGEELETRDPVVANWEGYVDSMMLAAPSIEDMFNLTDPVTGSVLFQSPVEGTSFATALAGLNKPIQSQQLPLLERKRALFGNDALFF